jgi:hypothetical protein
MMFQETDCPAPRIKRNTDACDDSVSLIPIGMEILTNTWNLTSASAGFLILAYVVFAANRKGTRPMDAMETVRYGLKDVLFANRAYLIYGFFTAGAILTFTGSFLLGGAIIGVFTGYSLYRSHEHPPDETAPADGWKLYLGNSIYRLTVLIGFLSLFTGMFSASYGTVDISILNDLAALFMLGIIFWKL